MSECVCERINLFNNVDSFIERLKLVQSQLEFQLLSDNKKCEMGCKNRFGNIDSFSSVIVTNSVTKSVEKITTYLQWFTFLKCILYTCANQKQNSCLKNDFNGSEWCITTKTKPTETFPACHLSDLFVDNNCIYFKQIASFIQILDYTYSYCSSCDGSFCSSTVHTIRKDVSQLWQNKQWVTQLAKLPPAFWDSGWTKFTLVGSCKFSHSHNLPAITKNKLN